MWQTTGGVETEAKTKATPETVQHKPLNINILCTAVGMQQNSALHILTTVPQQLSTFFHSVFYLTLANFTNSLPR